MNGVPSGKLKSCIGISQYLTEPGRKFLYRLLCICQTTDCWQHYHEASRQAVLLLTCSTADGKGTLGCLLGGCITVKVLFTVDAAPPRTLRSRLLPRRRCPAAACGVQTGA